MVSRRSTSQVVSKTSSAAAPATSSSAKSVKNSSILRSAFSPTRFQISLFASVIQGFDSQKLRIHHTITGGLVCDLQIGPKIRVTCLDWGYFGLPHQNGQSQLFQKKRKRSEDSNGISRGKHAIVAVGTSSSEIQMFSPVEGKIVQTLRGGHTHGIRDFSFLDDGLTSIAWSLGDDGKLLQWDTLRGTTVRSIDAPHPSVTKLLPLQSELLCASNTVYLVDPDAPRKQQHFPASKTAIHSLVTAPFNHSRAGSLFLAAAESDRYINIFETGSATLLGSLVTDKDVKSLAFLEYSTADQIDPCQNGLLAAVTGDGEVEVFSSPFYFHTSAKASNTMSFKLTRADKTRHHQAIIQVKKSSTTVLVLDATLEESDVVVVWVDGGVNLNFERLPWREDTQNDLALTGQHIIKTAKKAVAIGVTTTDGVKELGPDQVNESHTVVARGGEAEDAMDLDEIPEVIDISSAEEEEESGSEEEQEDDAQILCEPRRLVKEPTNGEIDEKNPDMDADPITEDNEKPTFGELVRANVPEVIDVSAAFPDPNKHALAPSKEGAPRLPSGMSLGTVLTQSLRTNDVNLLETCFHVHDLNIVRATIERLDSVLAASLLQKLAERLHKRPGRAGSLMVWVQWTLVAHGGYLASQPEVVKQLTSLHRVVKERASSLQPLLSLKGKLDMLEAQMNLRKSMQSRFRASDAEEDDNEDGIIYVEGQEELSSEEEGDVAVNASGVSKPTARQDEDSDTNETLSNSDEDVDDIPLHTNNGAMGSDDNASGSEDNGFIDNEASESDDDGSEDEDMEDEVDHDDVDSAEEDEESEMEAPALGATGPKLSNGRISNK